MKFYHKKSLGQHFIKDPSLHRKIATKAGGIENFVIIEVGPGNGGLSKAILEQNPKKLIMIEKDQDLVQYLNPILERHKENTELIITDASTIDLRNIVETQEKVKIIANLPYNVATNMIMNWLEYANFFTSITILIQKEVADRFLAKIGDKAYGRIAVLMQLLCDVKKDFDVPPGAFTPPPKVNSTLITINPLSVPRFNITCKDLMRLTKLAFAQPRKTILNNLKPHYSNIESILEKLNIQTNKRPENLALQDFYNIFETIQQTNLIKK